MAGTIRLLITICWIFVVAFFTAGAILLIMAFVTGTLLLFLFLSLIAVGIASFFSSLINKLKKRLKTKT